MLEPMAIGQHFVSPAHPPFIIAEMSGNHNGSLERALAIVEMAAKAGAHAIKLQTYTADTMTIDADHGEFVITNPESLWHGRTLYDLYREAHTPWEWHKPIFERARQLGIEAFSSAFDASSVDFLMDLGTPCFKVASFENTDIPLLRKVASTGKPVIVSTGTANEAEIRAAMDALCGAGAKEIILLKCTSAYPASPKESNLATIPDMRQRFGVQVGLSDHTPGIGAAVAAVALGACVIEKHVTLSRDDGGVDSAFSLEPAELQALVTETRRAWEALGTVSYTPSETEKNSLVFRRSLYVVKDIRTGEVFTAEHVRSIRPGLGLPPVHIDEVIGKKAAKDIKRGTALSWDLVGKA